MRFLYEYRTSDNVLHKGELSAASVDAVYSSLKRKGIKPSRVSLAPGLFNRLAAPGKRVYVIVGLSVLLVLLAVAYLRTTKTLRGVIETEESSIDRCQVYGDPVFLQLCERNGWTNVFASAGDCYLACHAQPGRGSEGLPGGRIAMLRLRERAMRDWVGGASSAIIMDKSDLEEVKRMKRIVKGMREELAKYLEDGGDVKGYCDELEGRQQEEALIRSRMIEEMRRMDSRSAEFAHAMENNNADLRTIGVRPIILSEVLTETNR